MKLTWRVLLTFCGCILWLSLFTVAASAALPAQQVFTSVIYHHPDQRNPALIEDAGGVIWQPASYSEFRYFHATGYGGIQLASVYADNTVFNQLGVRVGQIDLEAWSGTGETVSPVRSRYSSVDPFQFHGGIDQRYQHSGFALSSGLAANVRASLAVAAIRSPGLQDRTVRSFGISHRNFALDYIQVARASRLVGSAMSVSGVFRGHRLEYDVLQQDNGATWQALGYSRYRRGINYRIQLQAASNPLYTEKNQTRLMFSLSFRTGPGLRAVQQDGDEPEDEAASKNNYLIGGALVGAALALSSGDSNTDQAQRFNGQHGAAFDVLNRINPTSVAQNLEYGGYVYRNPDGSYSSTQPVRGTPSSVLIPPISQIVPGSSVARAAYHTHAGPDPRFDNENFSPADISVDIAFGLDGYLGTPAGAFKFHDISAGSITTLGKIAN
jgi:hypothetical protein